jgi:hypothetical protein
VAVAVAVYWKPRATTSGAPLPLSAVCSLCRT